MNRFANRYTISCHCRFSLQFEILIFATDSLKTPVGVFAGHNIPSTPSMNLHNVDNAAIQRAAAVMPNSVYSSLQQVAGGHTPYGGSYRPYQVSGLTFCQLIVFNIICVCRYSIDRQDAIQIMKILSDLAG